MNHLVLLITFQLLSIQCPQCNRSFLELQNFSDHVMREHEGLLAWLQFNGFDIS